MNSSLKTPRKRVANFTADEKTLLRQLIKKRPIIESKFTDGKTVIKKKQAWDILTSEFNSHAHVHKRDTITLKRAWDNMKASTRKGQATRREHAGSPDSPHSPQQEDITMAEKAAPMVTCEVKNQFDSDGFILDTTIKKSPSLNQDDEPANQGWYKAPEVNSVQVNYVPQSRVRKPADYVRKEAAMRVKHFESKKTIEMQILKTKLETAEAEKRAAKMEEERSKIRLEIAKLEFGKLYKIN